MGLIKMVLGGTVLEMVVLYFVWEKKGGMSYGMQARSEVGVPSWAT